MCEKLQKYLNRTELVGECREWTGCLNTDGYPRAGEKGNSNIKVHREVFFLVNGFYPDVVRHSCDNPICIEPSHLIDGTNLDNIRDRVERGRSNNHMDQETFEKIVDLKSLGKSYKEISYEVGRSIKSIDYALNERAGKVKG